MWCPDTFFHLVQATTPWMRGTLWNPTDQGDFRSVWSNYGQGTQAGRRTSGAEWLARLSQPNQIVLQGAHYFPVQAVGPAQAHAELHDLAEKLLPHLITELSKLHPGDSSHRTSGRRSLQAVEEADTTERAPCSTVSGPSHAGADVKVGDPPSVDRRARKLRRPGILAAKRLAKKDRRAEIALSGSGAPPLQADPLPQSQTSQSTMKSETTADIRTSLRMTTKSSASLYPPMIDDIIYPRPAFIVRQQDKPSRMYYGPSTVCNGDGTFAQRETHPGGLLAWCGGILLPLDSPTNHYQMEVTINDVKYALDATPTATCATDCTMWGKTNEYTWDPDRNNAKVTIREGRYAMVAIAHIKAREEIFWDYDIYYDWSHVICDSCVPALIKALYWVDGHLNQGRHTSRIDALRAITETWSAATIQSKGKELDDDLKWVILTASGALPLARRHYLIPPEESSWEVWLEVTLCSEIVYRNSAFRYVDNPQGCPQLTLLLHDGSVKTTGGSRMTAPRVISPTVIGPHEERCDLKGPYPYNSRMWRPELIKPPRRVRGTEDDTTVLSLQSHLSDETETREDSKTTTDEVGTVNYSDLPSPVTCSLSSHTSQHEPSITPSPQLNEPSLEAQSRRSRAQSLCSETALESSVPPPPLWSQPRRPPHQPQWSNTMVRCWTKWRTNLHRSTSRNTTTGKISGI